MSSFLVIGAILGGLPAVLAIDNGFGRTPVMGFNTYNAAACTINDTFISDYINLFSSLGFQSAGYKYFQLDCGWQGARQSNGSIGWDTGSFPDGIPPLAHQAISKGFEWSMYTDEGVQACDTGVYRPGSLGYETQDAAQFAGWNVAYMKLDNCYVTAGDNAPKNPRTDFVTRYSAMTDALHNVGIKGSLICQWGVPYESPNGLEGPAQWTPPLSTSFRVSDDIAQGWDNVLRIMNEAINVNIRGLSGPGNFADMDLLEVGNPGMTAAEQASHFAIWAMFKSALMVSTRLDTISDDTKTLLQNEALIAINQDSLGAPVTLRQRYSYDNDQYWGPLANGDKAVLLVDQSGNSRSLTLNLDQWNVTSATVTDLRTGAVVENTPSYTVQVDGHGSMAVRLSNIVYAQPDSPAINYYAAGAGTFSGGAASASCSVCTNGRKAGNITPSSSVTISGISTSQESQDVLFDYINAEVGYLGGGPLANVRGASISVNGGAGFSVLFPLTGYDWDTDVLRSFRVRLWGFNAGSSDNTITISGLSGTTSYAPDFDRVGVVA